MSVAKGKAKLRSAPAPLREVRKWLAELRSLVGAVAAEWKRDQVQRLAAALAYYALFSLAPLLIVVIGVAGFLFGREAARGELVSQFDELIGVHGARAVEELLAAAGTPGSGVAAASIGLALLLFGASGVFGELQSALNSIWNVEARPGASWKTILRRRFVSFAMVLGSGFLFLVSLAFHAAMAGAERWLGERLPGWAGVWSSVNGVLGLALPVALFALIFRLIPDAEVAWRDAWAGAVVTASLFALGRVAIGEYLGRGAVSSAYGAAGSLVAVVVWVYYSAQILFVGAELTQVLGRRRSEHLARPKPGAENVRRLVRRADAVRPARRG
jgi:membrane protein